MTKLMTNGLYQIRHNAMGASSDCGCSLLAPFAVLCYTAAVPCQGENQFLLLTGAFLPNIATG
jgi:hypothetical protein